MKALRLTQTVALAIAVSTAPGCSDRADKSSSPPSAAQPVTTLSAEAKRSCPVTVPNGQHPSKNAGFNHGNGSLWIALWPHGKLVAGTRPDGSSMAEIRPDGSIDAKLGWWRGVEGRLTIRGRRLDAPAAPLRADIPQGYGVSGFQATGIIFSTEGCWRVTGAVRDATLSFVTLVVKRRP
jgi:hypothetical protein